MDDGLSCRKLNRVPPIAQRDSRDQRKIVCTLNVGRDCILQNARDSIREAARSWGADYLEILTGDAGRHHWEEKLHLDEHLPDSYRVVYYDGDVIVRHDCPSPFEIVPEGMWSWCRNFHPSHAGTLPAVEEALGAYAKKCGVDVDPQKDYSNSGMLVFELPLHRAVFQEARKTVSRFGFDTNWIIADQGNFVCALMKLKTPVFPLPPMFELHGDYLWSGWTAEMKSFGYHFCGPINKEIGVKNTCWFDLGPDRYMGRTLRWSVGKPKCLMTEEVTYFIRQLASVWKGVIVEVGTYLGGSAWYGAQIARDNWSEYHCVDTWRGASDLAVSDEHYSAFLENMRDANLDRHLIVHRGTSSDVISQFEDGSVDCVYIDADHEVEACLSDIRLWWPKLKPNGVMLGHDFLEVYGVPEAVRIAFGQPDEVSWGRYPIWMVRKATDRLIA